MNKTKGKLFNNIFLFIKKAHQWTKRIEKKLSSSLYSYFFTDIFYLYRNCYIYICIYNEDAIQTAKRQRKS